MKVKLLCMGYVRNALMYLACFLERPTLILFLAHNWDRGVPTTAVTVFFDWVNSTTTSACSSSSSSRCKDATIRMRTGTGRGRHERELIALEKSVKHLLCVELIGVCCWLLEEAYLLRTAVHAIPVDPVFVQLVVLNTRAA